MVGRRVAMPGRIQHEPELIGDPALPGEVSQLLGSQGGLGRALALVRPRVERTTGVRPSLGLLVIFGRHVVDGSQSDQRFFAKVWRAARMSTATSVSSSAIGAIASQADSASLADHPRPSKPSAT